MCIIFVIKKNIRFLDNFGIDVDDFDFIKFSWILGKFVVCLKLNDDIKYIG